MWETVPLRKACRSKGLNSELSHCSWWHYFHLFSESHEISFSLFASDSFFRALPESREEERHLPKARIARETLCFQPPHRQMVSDGREGRGTDLYLVLTLLPWQSKQQKREMFWKRKEKEKMGGRGRGKKKKKWCLWKSKQSSKMRKKTQGLMKMLLPNPVRQVRSFATLNIQVQACFARRWGDLQYAGPGCK